MVTARSVLCVRCNESGALCIMTNGALTTNGGCYCVTSHPDAVAMPGTVLLLRR